MHGPAAVPACHLQGWDVALTDRGPVLVELEGDGGDPIMGQLCFDTGLLQGRYLAFVNKSIANAKKEAKEKKSRLRGRLQQNLSQLAIRKQPTTNAESLSEINKEMADHEAPVGAKA
jgi:hypothetical protein